MESKKDNGLSIYIKTEPNDHGDYLPENRLENFACSSYHGYAEKNRISMGKRPEHYEYDAYKVKYASENNMIYAEYNRPNLIRNNEHEYDGFQLENSSETNTDKNNREKTRLAINRPKSPNEYDAFLSKIRSKADEFMHYTENLRTDSSVRLNEYEQNQSKNRSEDVAIDYSLVQEIKKEPVEEDHCLSEAEIKDAMYMHQNLQINQEKPNQSRIFVENTENGTQLSLNSNTKDNPDLVRNTAYKDEMMHITDNSREADLDLNKEICKAVEREIRENTGLLNKEKQAPQISNTDMTQIRDKFVGQGNESKDDKNCEPIDKPGLRNSDNTLKYYARTCTDIINASIAGIINSEATKKCEVGGVKNKRKRRSPKFNSNSNTNSDEHLKSSETFEESMYIINSSSPVFSNTADQTNGMDMTEDDFKSDTPMENEDLEEPESHLRNKEKCSVDMDSEQKVGESLENVQRSEGNLEKGGKLTVKLWKNQEFSKNFKEVQRSTVINNEKSIENMININNEHEFGENWEMNQRYEVNMGNNQNSTVDMTKDHKHDQPINNYKNIEKSAVNEINNEKSAEHFEKNEKSQINMDNSGNSLETLENENKTPCALGGSNNENSDGQDETEVNFMEHDG
ncbi:Hypothetical predicted protein [Mytilus galloprovincialis]|uniref:Uncharacterized protein n=1 Tax=Mytilus galloprovincialis TaxID=29158 RepID=A0A8B6HA07_MYTGA|nr:Hypothetical predicted protein [Mytilus galloprovincialis]